jgi:hypothetical protein
MTFSLDDLFVSWYRTRKGYIHDAQDILWLVTIGVILILTIAWK